MYYVLIIHYSHQCNSTQCVISALHQIHTLIKRYIKHGQHVYVNQTLCRLAWGSFTGDFLPLQTIIITAEKSPNTTIILLAQLSN